MTINNDNDNNDASSDKDNPMTDPQSNEEEDYDFDQAWKEYSVDATPKAKTTTDGLFRSARDEESPNLAIALFFLSLTCLAGIAFVFAMHDQQAAVDNVQTTSLDDVDSAKGRFEALTGGVWF